ncbi:hypothetical protein MLD38_028634 [Melastoma candidum]|uniref:Uncharacterized protein n=1 Tax=Melastoma candidum TaxID=119954 RepID=A0ACB9N261_9MYRT|nr:hypothetical protein MLD38_028634 [Melastoma candidum]
MSVQAPGNNDHLWHRYGRVCSVGSCFTLKRVCSVVEVKHSNPKRRSCHASSGPTLFLACHDVAMHEHTSTHELGIIEGWSGASSFSLLKALFFHTSTESSLVGCILFLTLFPSCG